MSKKNTNRADMLAQEFVSDSEFNELLQEGVDLNREYFEKNEITGFIPQIWVCGLKEDDGKRKTSLIVIPDFSDETKFESLLMLGTKFYKEDLHKPVAIFMTTEAWTSIAKDDEGLKYKKPSEDPNRQEALVTAGLTIDGRTNMAVSKINRMGKDIISLGTAQISPYKGSPVIEPILLKNFYVGYLLAVKEYHEKGGSNGDQSEKN